MVQNTNNALKCTCAFLHARPVLLRNHANSTAGSTLVAPKLQQTVDLLDGKAERSGSFDELQLVDMVVVVNTVPIASPMRPRDEPRALIVANEFAETPDRRAASLISITMSPSRHCY